LQIPRRIVQEMLAQAVAELPNECCGLLAGCVADGLGRVVQRYPLVNAAASPKEYLSQPESMFAAHRDMLGRGLDIMAIYHSHPTSDPIPSRSDHERNYSPNVVNIIISLKASEPSLRGWWLADGKHQEAEWDVIEEDL
jgi:proteasome lid subunit RPN8/RPN11